MTINIPVAFAIGERVKRKTDMSSAPRYVTGIQVMYISTFESDRVRVLYLLGMDTTSTDGEWLDENDIENA